jgi:hypothetical protein
VSLSLILLGGFTANLLFAALALFGGIIYVKNLAEILVALVAAYSPNLALLLGALKAESETKEQAAKDSFRVAVISIVLWNLLLVARTVWFASTAWTQSEDSVTSVVEFWAVVGGTASIFVTGPLAFYLAKKEL